MIDKNIISVKFLSAVTKLSITACTVILYLHYFIPQSWGFFTIEPIQPLLNAYTVHNGVINNKSLIANNMSYGMGISRKGIILFNGLVKLIEDTELNTLVIDIKDYSGKIVFPIVLSFCAVYTPLLFCNKYC